MDDIFGATRLINIILNNLIIILLLIINLLQILSFLLLINHSIIFS
jgi:hypothetical protein